MKNLAFILSLSVLSSGAFAQYHNDIEPIKEARDAARAIVKSIEIKNMNLVVGAPEYPFIYKVFLEDAKNKEKKFAEELDKISNNLSYDYSILKSMEGKKKNDAVKQTVKDAEERFEAKVDEQTPAYHNALYAFISPSKDLMAKCLSTLCVNQVMEDYRHWIKQTKKLNEKLKLYKSQKLTKMKFKKNRFIDGYEDYAKDLGAARPIAIEENDERIAIISKYGIEIFSKFNFADIKKYGMDMLLKHGVEALNKYATSDLDKYGYETIKKFGLDALNKHGLVALQKYALSDLNKYGFTLLEKYGKENLEAYKLELLDKYGSAALKKFGVWLLEQASIEELETAAETFGLQNLKDFGFAALQKYPLPALKKYDSWRLEQYGLAKLEAAATKFGLDNVLAYGIEMLEKHGLTNLKLYGVSALESYGLDAIKKYGVSQLKKWGLDNLNKYGINKLFEIDEPRALVAGSAYQVGWNNSVDDSEKHAICTAVLGTKASAVVTYSWDTPDYYPMSGGTTYVVGHISGQVAYKQCPTHSTCRGWSKIFCAKE